MVCIVLCSTARDLELPLPIRQQKFSMRIANYAVVTGAAILFVSAIMGMLTNISEGLISRLRIKAPALATQTAPHNCKDTPRPGNDLSEL